MKKISFILLSAIALLFSACTESKFEMHQTNFYPQRPGGMTFYADQTYDSIKVFSYDPWTAEISAENPWFTFTPTSGDARPGTSALTRLDISMPQNTTGKNYTGHIIVKTYDNNTITMPIYQCSWLNIMFPTPKITGEKYEDQTVRYALDLKASEKLATISFHTYQDNATLTIDSDWITADKSTFAKGQNHVNLQVVPNNNSTARKATLTLTSGKISTPIYITQNVKKRR